MKLARYTTADNREFCGVVDGTHVVDIPGKTFEEVLDAGNYAQWGAEGVKRPLSDVILLPPIGTNAKIFCVGFNFLKHSAEMDRELPTEPTLFLRYPDSLVGHGTPVVRPHESVEFDWEGELAIVIGRPTRRIEAADAMKHVAGFTALADNSIRDWQFHSTQATAGKNWEASGSCGPWLVGADEIDGDNLLLTTRLNGEVMQKDTTANLHFKCADLIAYISTFTTLRPGDVIATGTPSGIGYRKEPPLYLKAGDSLDIEIEGIGVLSNPVIEETWMEAS